MSAVALQPCLPVPARHQNLPFAVAPDDLAEFSRLPAEVQGLVHARLEAVKQVLEAGSIREGAAGVAARMESRGRGWSRVSLQRLAGLYLESGGDWRVCLDKAKAGPKWQTRLAVRFPAAFREYLGSQWAMNQRDKFRSAYVGVLRRLARWRAGDVESAIPGYSAPPPNKAGCGHPDGWSYQNLRRAAMAGKQARRIVQIGPKAASNIGPMILSTREGLHVGEYYVFDDSWNDFKVLAYGQSCRLLSFHALDLLSGCNVLRGYKPALRDEHEVEERLKEREMVWLVTSMLTGTGYHACGCTLVVEKGTATLREREEKLLYDYSRGKIKVARGPAGGGPGVSGLFTGPSGGCPRWKAPLESHFNLMRNRTASMLEFPGQVGSNSRLNQPEGLERMERDAVALVRAGRGLTPERAELLRLGLLTVTEAILGLDQVTEEINRRTDHDLEGWRRCGFYVSEMRLSEEGAWVPASRLLAMSETERQAVAAFLGSRPGLVRERALSPREVFDAGRGDLVKLPMEAGALLLGDLPGEEIRVRRGILELSCPDLDPDEPMRFGLDRRDGRGVAEPLREGDVWLVRFNPLQPGIAWLYDARGGFAGVAHAYGRVARADTEGLRRAWGEKRKALAPVLQEARRLAAPLTQEAVSRTAHNAAVFGPRPLTAGERQAAAEKAAERQVLDEHGEAAADRLLDACGAPAEAEPDEIDPGLRDAGDRFLDSVLEPNHQ